MGNQYSYSAGVEPWAASTISHNVTADSFASKTLDPGATYRHTYAKAGSYPFMCTFHAAELEQVVAAAERGPLVTDLVAKIGKMVVEPESLLNPANWPELTPA